MRGALTVISGAHGNDILNIGEGNSLKAGGFMRFTITHPMHSHPYNPELVSGSGIATRRGGGGGGGVSRLRVHRPSRPIAAVAGVGWP